jgi:hypothetical protein
MAKSKPAHSPQLRQALLEIVENQLNADNPPAVRKTLARLMASGYSRDEAVELIACAVSTEIFDVLKNKAPYQEDRYVKVLEALPKLPWDEE